ncbi:hypothetical protein HA402_014800 [Bradysia odoriphaga]|nr:hypothetical protein HA402_014800 [Bradysia odoriphaga]
MSSYIDLLKTPQVCSGRKNGEHVPNLDDCSSFFVCNFGETKLFECPGGLLYDHSKRACNWENVVNCDRNALPDIDIETTLTYQTEKATTKAPETEQPTTNSPQTEAPITDSPQTEAPTTLSPQTEAPTTIWTQPPSQNTDVPFRPTIDPEYTSSKPVIVTPSHPVYNETDVVYPGLVEISPNIFHCMDPEFYFAPHPRNCEMYFICENYRIHPHECGDGVYWDYLHNRCNYPLAAICYSDNPTNNFGKMVCSSRGQTVEYVQDECRYVAADASSPAPSVVPGNDITCPDTQAFIAHESDCRKYYICIERMPIATSCPENTAWDKNNLQCNEESWRQCMG